MIKRLLKNHQCYGRAIDVEFSLNILENLSLIRYENRKTIVSDMGRRIVSLNEKSYLPNETQKMQFAHLLFENNNSVGQDYRVWLLQFKYNNRKNLFLFNGNFYKFPYEGRQWLDEMIYLKVIIDRVDYLTISDAFVPLMCFFRKEKLKLSNLNKILGRKKKIGNEAEEIVMKFEKMRLKNLGKADLTDRIKKISSKYCNAGYDIISFNGNNDYYDRFIEVKYSYNGRKFYISKNELETSKIMGEKYWLYLVFKRKNSQKYRIKLLKNFYKIYEKGQILFTPTQYKAIYVKNTQNYTELGEFQFQIQ